MTVMHGLSSMGINKLAPETPRLKGFVLSAINHALENPTGSCSAQIITSIMEMAIHEALWGSQNNYHLHVQGLVKMLRLRGGITCIARARLQRVSWAGFRVVRHQSREHTWLRAVYQQVDIPDAPGQAHRTSGRANLHRRFVAREA